MSRLKPRPPNPTRGHTGSQARSGAVVELSRERQKRTIRGDMRSQQYFPAELGRMLG